MGKENFIRGHGDNGHHDGRRSAVRRIQSALDQMRAYRQERITSHEQGHHPEPMVGGFYPEGEGTEIELFDPNVRECLDTRVTDSQVVGYLTPEAILRRQIYTPSISTQEDPRLRD